MEPFYFSIYWEFHHPNWRTPSFFRGVAWNHQSCRVSQVSHASQQPLQLDNELCTQPKCCVRPVKHLPPIWATYLMLKNSRAIWCWTTEPLKTEAFPENLVVSQPAALAPTPLCHWLTRIPMWTWKDMFVLWCGCPHLIPHGSIFNIFITLYFGMVYFNLWYIYIYIYMVETHRFQSISVSWTH